MKRIAFSFPFLLFNSIGLADWTQFRGPNGAGISKEPAAPLRWSEKENLVWKKPLPGAGSSSPIVFGERIYVTCYSGYNEPGKPGEMDQLKHHLICLDRASGALIWQKDLRAKLPEQPRIRDDHGYATQTPAADADAVYAFFGKSGVYAFDHKGNQLWHKDVGEGLNGWGSAASPVLYKHLVFINASVESGSLIALDKKTGNEVWRTARNQGIVEFADPGQDSPGRHRTRRRDSWRCPWLRSRKRGSPVELQDRHRLVHGAGPGRGEGNPLLHWRPQRWRSGGEAGRSRQCDRNAPSVDRAQGIERIDPHCAGGAPLLGQRRDGCRLLCEALRWIDCLRGAT